MEQELKTAFSIAGQEQVFKYFDELNQASKESLVAQLKQIDLNEIEELKKELLFANTEVKQDFSKLQPAPFQAIPADKSADPKWSEAKLAGIEALKAGRVAAFVVAGGQGTRLGFDAPKGLYKVSPVKQKSLFQIFAEKILGASRKYGVSIPWLIMTSQINDSATREFFKQNNFFGLKESDVIFFTQGLMPAVDYKGKFMLEAKDKIVMTPDGHGGCFRAMCRSGAIAELERRGIDCISYFQVDNPLINIIDPYFIGFHVLAKSYMSSKMIPKAYPLEKVGHFCTENGKFCIVEYSDLPAEYQQMRNPDGSLKFVAGSVAIHILSRDFINALGSSKDKSLKLPFHRADKKIPYISESGSLVKPEKPNGIKFEMFAFDALPMAKNPIIIEGVRGDEFSPVKNAEGVDSPLTCKNDQKKQFARWLESCGENIQKDADGVPLFDIEISPLFASNLEDFECAWKALDKRPSIADKFYLE